MSLNIPYFQLRHSQNIDDVICGVTLPYLPDFLSDTASIGANDAERIGHALERWIDLVANLWKWRGCAFSLRFRSRPANGSIDIALLARASAPGEQASKLARAMIDDLIHLLERLHIPSQLIEIAPQMDDYLSPFKQLSIMEIRQAEEVVPLQIGGDAYVVYPYWSGVGDWLALFETLLHQSAPALVNIHLEPSALHVSEQDMLAAAAGAGRELADMQFSGMYFQNLRIRDPQAELIGRIYAANLKKLAEPFMLTVQVASPEPVAVATIVRTLMTGITARPTSPGEQEQQLPARAQAITPAHDEEYKAAFRTLTALRLTDWGGTSSGPYQHRLRYLVDARAASAAFRLPIALRGGVPGVVARQVVPSYNIGPRRASAAPDEVVLGTLEHGGLLAVQRNELVRHALIGGFTRSGKTNTCLNILDQLWREQHIPFFAIEPVKTEYRGLLRQPGFEQLLVFTLGDESVAPFRLNPFELLPGVRLEAHIGALRTCFDAALPQFGVLPMLIEDSIHMVYDQLGWQLSDRGSEPPVRPYPTMRDLYQVLEKVVAAYAGDLKQNLQAALSKRVGSLLKGSKGYMFDTQRGIPIELLMERPVILEMDQLSADEQPLAIMFILMLVREYRRLHRSRDLLHVTLVEEAHLIMTDAQPVSNPEVSANTDAAGSQAFERMLAEVGGLGEGVIVAEQSPSKLVAGAINNTSLKIAHQMVGPREVTVMGDAMIMDEQQKLQIQRLRVGHAGVFMSGFEKATFMVGLAYKRDHQFDDQLADEDVANHMQQFYADHRQTFARAQPTMVLPFGGCQFCTSRCHYRAMVEPVTKEAVLHRQFYNAGRDLYAPQQTAQQKQGAWRAFVAVTAIAGEQAGAPGQLDAAWCYWVHQVAPDYIFKPEQRDQFVAIYREIATGNP